MLKHLVRDDYGLLLHLEAVSRVSFLCRVFDQLLDIVWIQSIHDIEKVLASRNATFRNLVWKISHELIYLLHMRPEVLDRELVVVGNCDKFDLAERHKLFFFLQYLSKKIFHKVRKIEISHTFIDHQLGRDIKLHLISKVVEEILF